ncbi:rod shape-determining protein MreC [Azospirillum doebereinerae]|uniref:Cell shape-determining protein MreC n=1 Tax=Azospirillum doebereinerae TaxID=92933 RepID=A0A3S0V0W1_9PROT|nr:rod shape-determining protein MreC [Azospirillum doebereinerae]MCG5241781.1 rod shape-determining protein MreC [Azospirillum doebereinerae]RUQ70117.1 rod shape-determining protein MreC [Azospirillum doebereinerae]
MKPRSSGSVVRLAAPLRALAQRFSFLLLVFASIALMMVGKIESVSVDSARARVTDAFAPILDAISRPAATAARVIESAVEVENAFDENQRLKAENARLLQWKQAALRLETENASLRTLLRVTPEPSVSFITARVIATPGSSFVRTLVVTAGRRDGVRKGQAALAGAGLVGRVIEVGEWSSRVLLLTDINARVPVVLESSRQRAVLAGDNSDQAKLLYLPPESPVQVGERVVTSGHGGLFPPGLPVGVVTSASERGVRVLPNADLSRVEHLRLVDFGLPGTELDLAAEWK